LTPGVLAAEISESGRHLGHVGLGHLVVVILGKGGGAAEGEHKGDGESFHHDPPSRVYLLAETTRQ
jgi:hypothetical protein